MFSNNSLDVSTPGLFHYSERVLSNRTITTFKNIQIVSKKSSNLLVKLLESRIFIRTAKYRKVEIELLTPVKNLDEEFYFREIQHKVPVKTFNWIFKERRIYIFG